MTDPRLNAAAARRDIGAVVQTVADRLAPPADVADLSEVKYLTVLEIATTLRVARMTAYRLIHRGELPAIKVGRQIRVPEPAFEAYMKDRFAEAGLVFAGGRDA